MLATEGTNTSDTALIVAVVIALIGAVPLCIGALRQRPGKGGPDTTTIVELAQLLAEKERALDACLRREEQRVSGEHP